MSPDTHLLLFAHPRSGSTSLYKILDLHPELSILEEPFNENFPRWRPGNKNYLELIHDIPSLDAQLAEIFTTHNGVKVLDYQLPQELMIHLLQRPDCKIIFLRRRNVLQAVVSVLIAQQNRLWKKWEMTQPLEAYYRNLQPFDIPDIQRRVVDLQERLDFFESVIDARPAADSFKVIYEDLYFAPPSQRTQQIAVLWQRLGLAPLDSEQIQYYLSPEEVKINSAETYKWLPNANDIQRLCGNDKTGWLFEEG